MLKTGKEHLECLRDGRIVYVGQERIEDVTKHPAFCRAARSIADLYDMKRQPENRAVMSFEEDGEIASSYFLRARSQSDLIKRSETHRRIASISHGLLGRSPDYVGGFVTGMATNPTLFGAYSSNILSYYKHLIKNDIFAAHAVLPPQAARDPTYYQKENRPSPTFRVVREEDDGVVVRGMKMLATGAVLSDEIWIGNILPLAPEAKSESITCAVPCNAPGLSLWSRKPLEQYATSEFDNPLTWRFDETDSMVLFDDVKVPWERVFVHNDTVLARELYTKTPCHTYGQHQANIRFLAKLQLIVGLASRITQSTGADQIPAVKETLGRLAAQEAILEGLVSGQIQGAETWPEGYLGYNRRIMYATLGWCAESYSSLIDTLRELCGGGVFQIPADISVMKNPELAETFETYWFTPQMAAVPRMKLFKLAWDMVGSEFAGRHLQYEKFFAGASFHLRNHSHREAPWEKFHGIVDDLLASYSIPEEYSEANMLREAKAN